MVSSFLPTRGSGLEPRQGCITGWDEQPGLSQSCLSLGHDGGREGLWQTSPTTICPLVAGPFSLWGWKNSHGSPRQTETGYVKACLYTQKAHTLSCVSVAELLPFSWHTLPGNTKQDDCITCQSRFFCRVTPHCAVLGPRPKKHSPSLAFMRPHT